MTCEFLNLINNFPLLARLTAGTQLNLLNSHYSNLGLACDLHMCDLIPPLVQVHQDNPIEWVMLNSLTHYKDHPGSQIRAHEAPQVFPSDCHIVSLGGK